MKTIQLIWSTDDILDFANMVDKNISELDAEIILENIYNHHDASIGVNWDVISAHIDMFLNDKK